MTDEKKEQQQKRTRFKARTFAVNGFLLGAC
jgi:hypothetical protein